MSRYTPLTLVLWALTAVVCCAVAIRARRRQSMGYLCCYLSIETALQASGLCCVVFGGPWTYYREFLAGQVAEAIGQGILLLGIWRSFYPRAQFSLGWIATPALILLAGFSAADFSGRVPDPALRNFVFVTHVVGYVFCLLVFATVLVAWVRCYAWPAASARVALGYSAAIGIGFGVEQSEAVFGYHLHHGLMYLPALSYLGALAIWNSACSLRPKTYTPEEVALLERSLARYPGIGSPQERQMISVLVGFAAATLAVTIILIRRQYRDRSIEEMVTALAKLTESTRRALNSLELSHHDAPDVVQKQRDLIIIWWNSRLFLTISRKAVLTVDSREAKLTAEYIAGRHKRVLNLMPLALMERAMRSDLHEYQSQLAVCYEEEVRSLELLLDHPLTELLRARA